MIIVSYARYIRVPAGTTVWRDYYNISSRDHQTTSYTSNVLLLYHYFSSPTICTWTYLLSSPLYASTPMYLLATRLVNHAACNVEPRPLNYCWNSVSTAQLVELTADVFKIILRQTSAAERQPRHGASTSEVSSDTVGVGEQDEGVSGRGAILIVS